MSIITTIRNATNTPVLLTLEAPNAVLYVGRDGMASYPTRSPTDSARLRGFINAEYRTQTFPDGKVVNSTDDKVMCVVHTDNTTTFIPPGETITLPPAQAAGKVFVGDHFFEVSLRDFASILPLTAFFKGEHSETAEVFVLAATPASNILEIRSNADTFPRAPSCTMKCKTLPSIRLTTHTKTALIVIAVSLGVVAVAFFTFLGMYLSLKRKCHTKN